MTDVPLENRLTALEAQHAQVVKERDELRGALATERIGRRFETSRLIAEKCALPADLIESVFRKSFKFEGDALVGYDETGKIFSRANPGRVADFDEALEILISQRPPQEVAAILKPPGSAGEGPAGGRRRPKVLNRSAFSALSAAEQKTHFKTGGTLVD
jgi:hypothetical protein